MPKKTLPLNLLDPDPQKSSSLISKVVAATRRYMSLQKGNHWWQLYRNATNLTALSATLHNALAIRGSLLPQKYNKWREDETVLKENIARFREGIIQDSSSAAAARQRLRDEYGTAIDDPHFDQLVSYKPEDVDIARTRLRWESEQLDQLRHAYIRVQVLALRALSLGAYGSSYRRTLHQPVRLQRRQAADIDFTKDVVAEHSAAVTMGYDELHQSLKNDVPMEKLLAEARNIEATIRSSAAYLGSVFGSFHALVPRLRNAEKQDRLLEVSISSSKLLADREVLYAYCSYIESESLSIGATRWYRYERERAKRRELASKVPAGLPITIEQIAGETLDPNELYRVSGIVSNLRIVDDPAPPKFSSLFTLTSISSESPLIVRSHMFSLANNGLSNGKMCEIVGIPRMSPRWSDTGLGMDIDRVSLGTLRRSAWIDDVMFRMRPYSKRYQDELNMSFAPLFDI